MLTKGLVEVMDVHVAVGNNNIGGDDELRMAARAGLILLEKNAALEVDVELLSTELHRYKVQHRELQMEVQTLRDQRKTAVLEVQAAHKEAKALQASFRTERATWHSTEQALTQQLRSLTSELQLARQQTQEVIHPTAHVASIESSNFDDHNLTTSLTEEEPATVEDPRVALLQAENDDLHVQVSQVLQELSQLQVSWSQSTYASNQRIQSLEHELHKLTRENKLLKEEQAEERDLIDSLRTMVQTYKKIADARPFGAAASTVGDDSNQDTHDEDRTSLSTCSNETHDLETSMHEDVMALNSALERRVRELEAQVAQTTSDDAKLLEEQLNGTKEALKHTKQQWIAAVTAKKEAQACTAAAHEELARMQEAFQNVQEKLQSSGTKPDDEYVDWMEDSVVHPAPPGWIAAVSLWMLMMSWLWVASCAQATSIPL
ncbi:hypothetical protein, variant [Aphanomyces invadans]|uniref:Uncharacterized protein n=1 Tax=Aphanomyces invadans TaxID=157072 RepID=A0A024TWN7_9STRA|nr:hypothetical protein, variant [Aphanomyces invadans]ETV98580.1 hypothetical protein, variant [Aphanomyces invadans]|eukprot:XP_008872777.1 hypothetical protein, variant [Aphanomyces invadans]